jgi:hypothetical protein
MIEEDPILEWLQSHLATEIEDLNANRIAGPDPLMFKKLAPHIHCKAGGSLSVQTGRHHYCSPRQDTGPWETAEVGYPQGLVGVRELIGIHHEEGLLDSDESGWGVFPYTPIELVAMLIAMNGGVKENEDE